MQLTSKENSVQENPANQRKHPFFRPISAIMAWFTCVFPHLAPESNSDWSRDLCLLDCFMSSATSVFHDFYGFANGEGKEEELHIDRVGVFVIAFRVVSPLKRINSKSFCSTYQGTEAKNVRAS